MKIKLKINARITTKNIAVAKEKKIKKVKKKKKKKPKKEQPS